MPTFAYNQQIADELCERVSEGETLLRVCNYDRDGLPRIPGTFPRPNTVYSWCRTSAPTYNAEFCSMFAEAQLTQQKVWIDQTIEIADTQEWGEETVEEDVETEHPEKGSGSRTVRRVIRKEMIAHRSLRIKTRQDALKMLNPELWAAKQTKADEDRDVYIHGGLDD